MEFFFKEIVKKREQGEGGTLSSYEKSLVENEDLVAKLRSMGLNMQTWAPREEGFYEKEFDNSIARIRSLPVVDDVPSESEDDVIPQPFLVASTYQPVRDKEIEEFPVVPFKTQRRESLSAMLPGVVSDTVYFLDGVCDAPKNVPYILTDDRYIQMSSETVTMRDAGVFFSVVNPPRGKFDEKLVARKKRKNKLSYSELNVVLETLEKEYPKYRSPHEDYLYHLHDTTQRLARDDVERFYRDCALRTLLSGFAPKTRVGVLVKEEFEFLRVQSLDPRLIYFPNLTLEQVDFVIVDPYHRAIENEGLETDYLTSRFKYDLENRAPMWSKCKNFVYVVNNVALTYVKGKPLFGFPVAPHRPRMLITNCSLELGHAPFIFSPSGGKVGVYVLGRNTESVAAMMAASSYRNYMITPIKNAEIKSYWLKRYAEWSVESIYAQLMPGVIGQPVVFDFRRRLRCEADNPVRSAMIMQIYDMLAKDDVIVSEEAFYGKGITKKDLHSLVIRGHLRVVISQKRLYYTMPIKELKCEYEPPDVLQMLVDVEGVYAKRDVAYNSYLVVPTRISEVIDAYKQRIPTGSKWRIYSHADRDSVKLPSSIT